MKHTTARMLFVVGVVALFAFAWTGIRGAFAQFSQTTTAGQELQSVAQLAYGILSLVSIVVWLSTRHWSWPVLVAWALSVALAGGLAPVVWGESSVAIGFLSGMVSLLIAVGIVWLLRFGSRTSHSR